MKESQRKVRRPKKTVETKSLSKLISDLSLLLPSGAEKITQNLVYIFPEKFGKTIFIGKKKKKMKIKRKFCSKTEKLRIKKEIKMCVYQRRGVS